MNNYWFNDRNKCVVIIDVESLMKAFYNKSRLVEVDVSVKKSFDAKQPFAPNHILEVLGGTRAQVLLWRSTLNSSDMASCHSWCFKTCDIVVGSIWEHEWSLVSLSLVRGLWILFLALVCMGWVLWGVECVRWGSKGNDDNRLGGEDG